MKVIKGKTIKLVLVTALFLLFSPITLASAAVSYSAHVENIGWMTPVTDGTVAGTEGRSLQMEVRP